MLSLAVLEEGFDLAGVVPPHPPARRAPPSFDRHHGEHQRKSWYIRLTRRDYLVNGVSGGFHQ